jgi:hypothetical protein
VASPGRHLALVARKYILHKGIFRTVTDWSRNRYADYILSAEIEALEEIDTPDGWKAHLALTFRLSDGLGKPDVWSWQFDKTAKVPSENVPQLLNVLSSLYGEALDGLCADLRAFIMAHPKSRGPADRKP